MVEAEGVGRTRKSRTVGTGKVLCPPVVYFFLGSIPGLCAYLDTNLLFALPQDVPL